MYAQIQVLILIHGHTTECAVKSNFVFVILAGQLKNNYGQLCTKHRICACITYLTDSDHIKIAGIGPIPIQMPRIGAALL